ncbi:MAG: hypothetical protein LBV27_10645 [Oscillospiraceae bacterium]|nr:hypothetical protein [Oscillospiraceae bacterium]
MSRNRRYKRGRGGVSAVAIAFGIGLCIAMCCSVKLTLFIAALLIIYIGVTSCC